MTDAPLVYKIDHIAIATTSIAEAARFYTEGLGLPLSPVEEVPEQKVRVVFVQLGDVKIELMEPTAPDSPIQGFLDKRGPGLHHICYASADVGAALAAVQERGVRALDQAPRVGAHGARIAFLHPKSTGGVLSELSTPGH